MAVSTLLLSTLLLTGLRGRTTTVSFLGFFIGVVKHGSAQHESTYTATPLGMLFLCRQWDGKLGSE